MKSSLQLTKSIDCRRNSNQFQIERLITDKSPVMNEETKNSEERLLNRKSFEDLRSEISQKIDRSTQRNFRSDNSLEAGRPIDRVLQAPDKDRVENRDFHSEADKVRKKRPPFWQGESRDRKQRVFEPSSSPF